MSNINMKLLLTSAGITNDTLKSEFLALLGKSPQDANIAIIPTAHNAEPGDKSWVVAEDIMPFYNMDCKGFSIVDLAAVSSLDKTLWWPQLEEADAIVVGGGNVFYLSYWMQQTGLYDVLPEWLKTKVYVGISAGSQVAGSDLYATVEVMERDGVFDDADYDSMGPTGRSSSKTMKLVNFTFRPHLNSPNFSKIRLPYLEQVAQTLKTPMYALDDNSAIKVTDNHIEIVGGGEWHRLDSGIDKSLEKGAA